MRRSRLAMRFSGCVLAAAGMTMGTVTSCSDDPRTLAFDESDASPTGHLDANVDTGSDAPDATSADAMSPELDSGKSDAGPLAVTCATPPCATALVTTLSEGFCALLGDQTVACWGQNSNAELGRGDDAGTDDGPTAARVVGLEGVSALAHTCAIDTNGAVWCWGTGPWLRSLDVATTTEPTPVKLEIPAATKLAVADTTACAVVADGVLCWGANVNGQVAIPEFGVDPNAPLEPRAVDLPNGAPIQQVAIGNAAFVLRNDGTMVSWGKAPPLARISSLSPDPYPEPIPLTGIFDIETAADNACALVEGIAYCWGSPIYTGFDTPLEPLPQRRMPAPVTTPEPVVQIATTASVEPDWLSGANALAQRACAAGVSGAVYCWGTNSSGQSGDGTTNCAYTPVMVTGLPSPVARLATTPRTTCALLTNGKVYCWGDGAHGQLGDGSLGSSSLVPKEVILP